MVGVRFNHQAPPIKTVPGYERIGEITGTMNGETRMPREAKCQKAVVFSTTLQRFHTAGCPAEKVDSSGWVSFNEDGTMTAGWKEAAPA